jgi:hypothetical protein
MKPSNISDQARAKLIWGEPANAVHEFLTSNGFSDIEAERKIAEFCAERNLDIRKIGIKKILIGGGLSFITSAHFFFAYQGAHIGSSYRSAKGNAIIALVGLYGMWKLIDGIIYLARPQSETKSITEISE